MSKRYFFLRYKCMKEIRKILFCIWPTQTKKSNMHIKGWFIYFTAYIYTLHNKTHLSYCRLKDVQNPRIRKEKWDLDKFQSILLHIIQNIYYFRFRLEFVCLSVKSVTFNILLHAKDGSKLNLRIQI